MTNKILMGASFLALLAAFPAFAETNANPNETTGAKVERTLEETGNKIERSADKAAKATKEKYNEVKKDVQAYFSDDDDVAAMASVDVSARLTGDELIGRTVQRPNGDALGKIEDILVDREGDAETVVINDGGVLGLGGKLAAFDYDVIEGLSADRDVVVKLTQQNIDSAKRFEYKAPSQPDPKIAVMPADQFSLKQIIGAKVVDANGKNVAKVDDVAFEDDDADYLIVTFDRILGMGGNTAALNFEALELTNNNGKYTFNLNCQQTAQFQNH